MKTETEIKEQLRRAYMERLYHEKNGKGLDVWRKTQGYINALKWVLGEE